MNWKTINGYDDYQVSDEGEVRSLKFGKTIIRKPSTNMQGYFRVSLWQNGEEKHYKVHRLVLCAFVGPCPAGMEANHLDGDKSNNRLENLEWIPRSWNCAHAYRIGLGNIKAVLQFTKDRQFITKYESGHEASRRTGGSSE